MDNKGAYSLKEANVLQPRPVLTQPQPLNQHCRIRPLRKSSNSWGRIV